MPKTIVYSHGFGVRKDDRGLFSDIAQALPDYRHVMFDYNVANEAENTLLVAPLDAQAEMLQAILADEQKHADTDVTLIAHSQGCVSVGLAHPTKLARIILLAPPAQVLGVAKKDIFKKRPDTVEDSDGTLHYLRRDGSTTIIRNDYWQSRQGIHPIELYNMLAAHTSLTVIVAENDEVLTNTDYSELSQNVQLIHLSADHNFSGPARAELLKTIHDLV